MQKIRFVFLLLLVILITLYHHPFVYAMNEGSGIEKGSVLSPYIYIIFILLCLFSFGLKPFKYCNWLKKTLIYLGCIAISLWIASIFFKLNVPSDIRTLAIPISAVFIGWQCSLSQSRYKILVSLFIILTAFVAVLQIKTNIGAFVIEDHYMVDNKNSLGVVIGTASILSFVLFIQKNSKKVIRIFFLIATFFLLLCNLTIRARMATLSLMVLLFYMVYLRSDRKCLIFLILGFLGIFIIALVFIPQVFDYVYGSFFSGYEGEDVTSDRLNRNLGAIAVFMDDPFFCNIEGKYHVHQVHNYFLKTLYEKGMLFGLPILLMYLYHFFNIIKCSRKRININDNLTMGFIVALYPFFISLAETTLPYGPGTDSVMNFIILGMAYRNEWKEK